MNMDSNLNLTACITIPPRGETVFVWKNALEVESEPPGSGFLQREGNKTR